MSSSEASRLSLEEARQAFLLAQGLPPRADAPLRPTLERTGFVRTLGGIDAYLALRARVPSVRRADIDALVASGEARVVPAARGCMYVVAKRDVPLALRFADALSRPRVLREYDKAGIRASEIDELGRAVVAVLGTRGALTTDALKKALP